MRFFMLLLTIAAAICPANAQLFDAYTRGHYLDGNNQPHHGLIKFDETSRYIKFKADADQKATKLTTDDITGFVTDKDTFAVVGEFEVPYGLSAAVIPGAFAKVLQAGEVTLYVTYSIIGYGQTMAHVESYLLRKRNSSRVVRVPTGPVKFKRELSSYFSDSGQLSQRIKDGSLAFDQLSEIVERYNQEHRQSSLAGSTLNGF